MSRPSLSLIRSQGGGASGSGSDPRPRVLVVEDERIVAAYLQLMLRELGYDAYAAAANASKALALAEKTPPDVVLADIRIEGPVDGIEVASQLRRQHGAAVIFLTAHADDPTIERSKQAEPSGYLVKPITAPAVKAAVEVALDRRARDLSARAMEKALSETSADLLSALNHLPLAVQLEDGRGRVVHVNPAYRDLFGLTHADLVLTGTDGALLLEHVGSLSADPDRCAIIIDSLRRSHEPVAGDVIRLVDGRRLELDYVPVLQGNRRQGQLWTFRDISDTERTREELEQATARHRTEVLMDPLTQLTSRRGFFELAPTYLKLARCARDQVRILFFVDLDDLKLINDQHGHAAGDEAICLVAQALRSVFRASDLLARLGGDEFIVLANMASAEVATVGQRLGARLRELGTTATHALSALSVSIGTAEYHAQMSLKELVSLADGAMYSAKEKKRMSAEPHGD